jgi:hypothetical protein
MGEKEEVTFICEGIEMQIWKFAISTVRKCDGGNCLQAKVYHALMGLIKR